MDGDVRVRTRTRTYIQVIPPDIDLRIGTTAFNSFDYGFDTNMDQIRGTTHFLDRRGPRPRQDVILKHAIVRLIWNSWRLVCLPFL